MNKINKIIIGSNNEGKYREICELLPNEVEKISPKELNILSPKETGKNFSENSLIKASYFSSKTNMICLADDSGLEIDILDGNPGIHSARWGGKKKNFDLAIQKVFKEIKKKKKNFEGNCNARFICCMTLLWPNGKNFSATGVIEGKISSKKKGLNGFGYDPIFIPDGYRQTFGEMKPKEKISIDHRFKAYSKIKHFFI